MPHEPDQPLGPSQIAERYYGIVGSAHPLPGENDDNTRIESTDGRSFMLRVSPVGSDFDRIRFVETVIRQSRTLGVATPTAVSSTSGCAIQTLPDGRIARLYRWVEGHSFAEAGRPPEAATSIGHLTANLVLTLADLAPGPVDGTSIWNLSNAHPTIASLRHHLVESDQQALITLVLDRLKAVDFSELPEQVIHHDLNDENVLVGVSPSEGHYVVGIIDFEDSAQSYRIGELAIACTYAMLAQDHPVAVATDLINGYASRLPINASEAAALLDLILARLATSVVISASRGSDNPHHQLTSHHAWNLLKLLLGHDSENPLSQDT